MSPTVYVAMSGGIDSSVTAALLQREGYVVRGLTMTMPGVLAHAERAAAVARHLNIGHEVIDVSAQFSAEVIDPFCRAYLQGKTPNPCVKCNELIKFGLLAGRAAAGEAFFATGHYARVYYDEVLGRYELHQASDGRKDQSYVLYVLTQEILSRLRLPLGAYAKHQVKQMAREWGLPVPDDAESQDICFIPGGDYGAFIHQRCGTVPDPGDIVLADGTLLGRHRGTLHYTIGQRKGLGVSYKYPLFVVAIDRERNRVILGREEDLYAYQMRVEDTRFTHPAFARDSFIAAVKIRYASVPAMARVERDNQARYRVAFFAPQKAITPGQAAVFYDRERVLGGGTIADVACAA